MLQFTKGSPPSPRRGPNTPARTGTTAAAADIHGPGEFLTDVDADVIWLGPNDAVELAHEILRLAVPLLEPDNR
jgi:hypothetical protein